MNAASLEGTTTPDADVWAEVTKKKKVPRVAEAEPVDKKEANTGTIIDQPEAESMGKQNIEETELETNDSD